MSARQLNALRITLLAALGVTATWGCGDDDGNDDDRPGAGAAGKKPQGGGGGIRGGAGGASGGARPSGGMSGSGGSLPLGGGSDGGFEFGGGGVGALGGGGFGGGGEGGQPWPDISKCRNPRDVAEGYVRCDGGWLHRPERAECPIRIDTSTGGQGGQPSEAGGAGGTGGVGDATTEPCFRDSDCTSKDYGHCEPPGLDSPLQQKTCIYGCKVDDDCGTGSICVCGPKAGTCAPAACKSDADCDDVFCAASELTAVCAGTPYYEFACQKREDACTGNGDCGGGGDAIECQIGPAGNRICLDAMVCGRPFLVEGEVRQAAPVSGSDWAARGSMECPNLNSRARRELKEHWTRMALMEHASVAAFARFTLELLSLGAPADLLAATQRAMGDEIAHAQACFALASTYAGHAIGAGPISLEGAVTASRSKLDIVRCAFLEACIGETIAAAEAFAALERATDPTVRAVLARIADDESRHAELGWRFLGWVLASDANAQTSTRSELEALLEAELANSMDVAIVSEHEEALAAHGLLPRSAQLDARRAALSNVVLPCARALGIVSADRAA